MGILQKIKNYLGEHLGYVNCSITGDTLWMTDSFEIPYTDNGWQTCLVSSKVLSIHSKDELAKIIFDKTEPETGIQGMERVYFGRRLSIEEIAERIPSN